MNVKISENIDRDISFFRDRKSAFDEAAALQKEVWGPGQPDKQPLLFTDWSALPPAQWHNAKEIHYDKEKMLANELYEATAAAAGGMQAVPSARANMGCGIYPTLFGVRQELFEHTMPWVRHHLDKETIRKMGPEDLKIGGEFRAGLEHMAYMAEALDGTGCRIYPMDLQGPFDIAHLVYGDVIYYDVYDDPDFVHHLLNLACEAIFLGMDACLEVIPGSDREIAHYSKLIMPREKGGLKISEDSLTLLSKEMIREFGTQYTEKALTRYGGGYIHYCGKNDHLFAEVMRMPLAFGINFGNPEKHDMDAVLRECAANGKVYYGAADRREGENLRAYFARCLSNARKDGKIYLLLEYLKWDKEGEGKAEIAEAWEGAQGEMCAVY